MNEWMNAIHSDIAMHPLGLFFKTHETSTGPECRNLYMATSRISHVMSVRAAVIISFPNKQS